ncbi:ATP-dependent helicase [Brevibacillus sp. HD1.4A]|uniref:ATP-dependent helicase n=1 Tax=Brevibacillus sp. HD1.4A TaxID=2738978 RepID=UPI00156BB4F5|nr:ATP-dependent helicase [Brevibacillus sp. HD1.4A]NRQ51954.1 ATP-dependent helicase [Brevibacillus sp. HD1.4A]
MMLLDGLNTEQRQAATSDSKVILCLAGAGTGKTKTLTTRIAYLHDEKRVGTSNMLALTFTRLAGLEMKERIARLIGEESAKKLFCNTFHSFCVSVLREWGHRVGLEPNFSIYDQDDQTAIITAILDEFRYDAKVRQVLDCINRRQRGQESQGIVYDSEQAAEEYLYRMRQSNAVGLDELLLKTLELMKQPDISAYYRNQYKYVYVDEFQDTDDVQMDIIRHLAPENLFVVGDDYQAIYGFRGANVQNILNFPSAYQGCEVVKLERNYRSTEPIVTAANLLIQHNHSRTDKKLINDVEGPEIEVVDLTTPEHEGAFLRDIVMAHKQVGSRLANIAVLARTNGQLTYLKDQLHESQIAATVVSRDVDPIKRVDIKKLMSFLNFVVNPKDEKALWLCINFPHTRLTDLEKASLLAQPEWSSDRAQEVLKRVGGAKIQEFVRIIEALQTADSFFTIDAYEAIKEASYALGMKGFYAEKGLHNRVEDMMAALRYTKRWCHQQETSGERNNIEAFLKWLRIRDIQDFYRKDEDAVQLLTVHGSKGLEFDTVILVGMNQGTFPSKRTEDMEEERRLAYVAVTRAKRRLILTRPREVALYGKKTYEPGPSQFVAEMGLQGVM